MRGGTFGTLNTVTDHSQLPYGGAGDSQAGSRSLADRFRRHAESLVRAGRSPLYVRLMGAAADDINRGGRVARLFAGIRTPPGSVPQLRMMGALHYLVLSGQAPGLAAFYPSAGGAEPLALGWSAADAAIDEHFDQIRTRLHRAVQTNEPGRSAVRFAGLLWLADRHRRPIRLLEVGPAPASTSWPTATPTWPAAASWAIPPRHCALRIHGCRRPQSTSLPRRHICASPRARAATWLRSIPLSR